MIKARRQHAIPCPKALDAYGIAITVTTASLYCAKQPVDHSNETGLTDMRKICFGSRQYDMHQRTNHETETVQLLDPDMSGYHHASVWKQGRHNCCQAGTQAAPRPELDHMGGLHMQRRASASLGTGQQPVVSSRYFKQSSCK